MSRKKDYMVMFPFMAQGHIIPFLSLAKQISQRTNFTITLVNTPLNIKNLISTLSTNSTTTNDIINNIHLEELPFLTNGLLPPNSENSDTLPPHQFIQLLQASETLQPSFHNLISKLTLQHQSPPLCIISDVFLSWTVDVARSFKIPHIGFTTCGAYGTAAYFSIWLNLPHRQSTDENGFFKIPGFPETALFHLSQLHPNLLAADGEDPWSSFYQKQISLSLKSDGLLCNSVEKIEPLGLELLRKNTGIPVWPIGPVLPPQFLSPSSSDGSKLRAGREDGIELKKCMEWLDLNSQGSVLYISFGSQNTIKATQMMELAKGLEASGSPFIWVIRPPLGFNLKEEFRTEWLPEGFEERMVIEKKKGLLIKGWAPQLEILSHKSTRGFLSHCGWNSVLESLSQGVVIIGWPLRAEQAYNSKMLVEEMGVSVELGRGVDCRIVGEEVEEIVRVVMEREGKGEKIRERAAEIAEKIRSSVKEEDEDDDHHQKGSSVKALDDFLGAMMSRSKVVPS